jgi:hypothetical protein
MVDAMTLLVDVPVAVTVALALAVEAAAATAVQRLVIHSVGLLEASARRSVWDYSGWKRGDMELGAKGEGRGGMSGQRQRPVGSPGSGDAKCRAAKESSCLQLRQGFS